MQKSTTQVFMAILLAWTAARAATITVTTNSGGTGGPDCTLRDAITAANTDSATGGCPPGDGADVIDLPTGAVIGLSTYDSVTPLPFPYNCLSGLPWITSEIEIHGNAAVVQRSSPGTNSDNFRIFHVADSGNLTLRGLTVSGGGNSDFWQGSCYFIQTQCLAGGGLLNEGTLTLIESTIDNNRVCHRGGGVINSGSLILANSEATGNVGGGIANMGTATLIDSRVTGNYGRGGISNDPGGIATLTRCTISGNDSFAGGGIGNGGTMTVTNSTVSGNRAGGAVGEGAGGAASNSGTLTLANCTVSGNITIDGYYSPALGGTIANSGTLWLDNTIIANSSFEAPGYPQNFPNWECTNTGTLNDVGHNIIEDGSCIVAPTSTSGDPNLGPLADNGGSTRTHALLPQSIALDAGDCAGGAVAVDQRGAPRPQGPSCDIGSFELAPSGPGVVSDLLVDKSGSDLLLSWDNDCGTGDRYGVYRGDLALGSDSLAWEACDLQTNTATIAMGPADGEFFLVVPSWNGEEGSYGSAGEGQRPAAFSACHAQGVIDWCAP